MHRENRNIYIGAAVRTPIGKFGGGLSPLTSPQLGVISAQETLRRSGIDATRIDEVIFGCSRLAGVGTNPARQVAFKSGLPESVPGFTINKACGSSLKAIMSAYQAIALEDAEVVLAGGMDSLSNVPYLLMKARWGYRMGNEKIVDGMYQDGYLCHLCDEIMGSTADTLGKKYGISRKECDEYALMSQQRCKSAWENSRFDDEIKVVEAPGRKGTTLVEKDEHPRPTATLEGLAKLKPVFHEDGVVTAGNASGITDGAATMLVFSEDAKQELNLKPLVRIIDYTTAGVDPALMGIGPVPAIRKLLSRNDLTLADIDLIELNEAFAVQVLACDKELNFDMDRVNVNGGAIALGHPTGCTGARITVTLAHEMRKRQASLGVATLCVSGGLGVTLLVENVSS